MIMAECRIPGHITGLYIFAVVNLCALLNISLVSADVFVIDVEKNSTIDTIQDKQAMFGGDVPDDGLLGRLIYVIPSNACHGVETPPAEVGLAWIALIARGQCQFDQKIWYAQKAGFSAAIVHNYAGNDAVIPMAGDSSYADEVKIPAVFVGYTNGMALAHLYNYTRRSVVIKMEEPSDEPPATFFLPFVVVVSICFLGVMGFSIIKCVKYIQYIRRTRLSKSALRKIPTSKYKKGDHYDTCAICLEDYEEGEKLRVLPCNHTYHCKCIDPWLTKRKKTCPQCKRRVIPSQESDSDSDGDEEAGASENTPLLANNNNRRPGPSSSIGTRRPLLTSSNQRSGETGGRSRLPRRTWPSDHDPCEDLPHPESLPQVIMVSEGHPAFNSAPNREGLSLDSTEEEEEEEEKGAVGGVGISDIKDFEEASTEVIIEAEPALHSSSPKGAEALRTDPEVQEEDPSDCTPDDARQSPARTQGSVNAAFTSSASSEEDGSSGGSNSGGGGGAPSRRGGRKKKARRNNQVV